MTKPIIVRLKTTPGGVKYLDIDDSAGGNIIPKGKGSVVWEFDASLHGAQFNEQSNPLAPGFSWIGSTPNAPIFCDPTLSPSKQTMTLSDDNHDESTVGTWYYRVSATIDGTVYLSLHEGITRASPTVPASTTAEGGPLWGAPMGSGNPTIKNR